MAGRYGYNCCSYNIIPRITAAVSFQVKNGELFNYNFLSENPNLNALPQFFSNNLAKNNITPFFSFFE